MATDGFVLAFLYFIPNIFWGMAVQFIAPSTALTIEMSTLVWVLPMAYCVLHTVPTRAQCASTVTGSAISGGRYSKHANFGFD